MRLLTRKIYRAFPELDQFDDETLKAIEKNVRKDVADVGCALQLAVVYFSSLLWMLELADRVRNPVFALVGFVLTTWACTMITRNIWLYKCIRKHIQHVRCRQCGYSLFGLPVINQDSCPIVVCPECSEETALAEYNLTAADVDPTLKN